MNASEVRDMSESDMQKELVALRKELFNLRVIQKGTGQLTHPHRMRQAKRDIARILTVLAEKEGK